MGLFSLFGRKNKKTKTDKYSEADEHLDGDGLEEYSGMRMEITTPEGQVLFIAKLMNIRGTTAELYQYSKADLSSEPQETINIRIRGYDDQNAKAVYLEGTTIPTPEHIWKVENLALVRVGNDRAFFRVDTNIEAAVTSLSKNASEEEPCRLLNISVGGACIISDKHYRKGERLLLNVKSFEERYSPLLFCKILRVTEKDYLGYEYGCRFLEMNETEQRKIAQIIFDLQHKKIPSQTESSEAESSETETETSEE